MEKRLTNKEIRQAAAAVRQSMLKEIEQEEIPEHSFSASFQDKIQDLSIQNEKHKNRSTILRRCAAAMILIVLGFSTVLMTGTDARAAIMGWFKETLEGKNIFHFQGTPTSEEFPDVELRWIPEGIKCTQNEADQIGFSLLYEDPEDPSIGFTLGGGYMSDGTDSIMGYDDAPHRITSVKIGELPGEFYLSEDSSAPNGLIWFDEANGVFFVMTSYYSPEIMERIAEGVELEK